MNTSQALARLYQIINKEMGSLHAKDAVTTAIFNVVSEIQEEGKEVTANELEAKLESYVNDFIYASKKSDVA